jgi:hypothetical protein
MGDLTLLFHTKIYHTHFNLLKFITLLDTRRCLKYHSNYIYSPHALTRSLNSSVDPGSPPESETQTQENHGNFPTKEMRTCNFTGELPYKGDEDMEFDRGTSLQRRR